MPESQAMMREQAAVRTHYGYDRNSIVDVSPDNITVKYYEMGKTLVSTTRRYGWCPCSGDCGAAFILGCANFFDETGSIFIQDGVDYVRFDGPVHPEREIACSSTMLPLTAHGEPMTPFDQRLLFTDNFTYGLENGRVIQMRECAWRDPDEFLNERLNQIKTVGAKLMFRRDASSSIDFSAFIHAKKEYSNNACVLRFFYDLCESLACVAGSERVLSLVDFCEFETASGRFIAVRGRCTVSSYSVLDENNTLDYLIEFLTDYPGVYEVSPPQYEPFYEIVVTSSVWTKDGRLARMAYRVKDQRKNLSILGSSICATNFL